MDASKFIILALLLAVASCSPMVQDGEMKEEDDVTGSTSQPSTESSTPSAPKDCTTPLGLAGACVAREYCDYGTPAVDMTLYATKSYVKTCKAEEVCCPQKAIILLSDSSSSLLPSPTDDNAFDFDEDD